MKNISHWQALIRFVDDSTVAYFLGLPVYWKPAEFVRFRECSLPIKRRLSSDGVQPNIADIYSLGLYLEQPRRVDTKKNVEVRW